MNSDSGEIWKKPICGFVKIILKLAYGGREESRIAIWDISNTNQILVFIVSNTVDYWWCGDNTENIR
jgi:hypothetical protein